MAFLTKSRRPSARWNRQAGQTMILVVVVLGIFLLGFIGFAVDYSNMWFHRQMAQSAADAACQAGAMDMLSLATGGTPSPGMTMGTDLLSCPNPAVVPPTSPPHTACWYAARNNYPGYGVVPNTESNNVSVRYISSVPGVSNDAGYNFLRVDVLDRVRTYFSVLLSGNQTQDVIATAKCGLVLSTAPIPIVVLHPHNPSSFQISGTPSVKILGGPQKSIQVNSDFKQSGSNVALNIGGTANLDVSQGGPSKSGSDVGVFGSPKSGYYSACASPTSTNCWLPGSTSHWSQPASPISDPLAGVPPPSAGTPGDCSAIRALNGFAGTSCTDDNITYAPGPATATTDPTCPVNPADTSHWCTRYWPGTYTNREMGNLSGQGGNVLFVPGVYYFGGSGPQQGLKMGSQTLARPSALSGDGNGGAMFYFTGSATLDITANSGSGWTDTGLPPAAFDPVYGPVPVQCPGGPAPDPPLIGTMTGNIFLGPCTGTYGFNGFRGMIFFQDRAVAGSGTMGGQGSMLIAGNIYFHQIGSYGSSFSLGGGSGSSTQVLGEIIVDQLNLGGNGGINMQLNSLFVMPILKVQLLQ